MISYDQAKTLKDVGFPQDEGITNPNKYGSFRCVGKGSVYIDGVLEENHGAFKDEVWTGYNPFEEVIYVPTLSELIEACGDDFWDLSKGTTKKGIVSWTAGSTHNGDFKGKSGEGSTPEEAMVNFYIKLKK